MLKIVAGPDDVCGGSCWLIMMCDSEGYWDSVASGGTARGPKDSDNPDAWLSWVQRQVAGETRKRIKWSQAEVTPFGWSQGAGHAPQGITVLVATA